MLDYVIKLTHTPGEMNEADVDALRVVGFDDRGVLDICQVASYYNYVNRLADGTGVELESFWDDEDLTITRAEFESLRTSGGGPV